MDFSAFPRFTDTDDPDEAVKQIEALRNAPTGWMKETPELTKLEDFQVSPDKSRYTVDVDDVPFECLYFPSEHRKLYIMLSGGRAAGVFKYPVFMRWKFSPYFKGHMLCVDDPMFHFHKKVSHANWFYGTPEKSYLVLLLKIVKKLMDQFSISAEDVTFIGSSAGGYAAIYLANLLDYSSAIAMNPQLSPADWYPEETLRDFSSWGIDLTSDNDPFNRNKLMITNPKSWYFITVNQKSAIDFRGQLKTFYENSKITPKFGLTQKDNILFWVLSVESKDKHVVYFDKAGLSMCDFMLQQVRKGFDANQLYSNSQLINEQTVERYRLMTRIMDLSSTDRYDVKPNRKKYHIVPGNLVLEHESGGICFDFDRNTWESQLVNNKLMLTTRPVNPPIGKYAALPLARKLEKGKEYVLKLRFMLMTKSNNYYFLIKQSMSANTQLIYNHTVNHSEPLGWTEKEIVFSPSSDVYDEFMIGANQLRGEDAFISFDYITITEKTT